MQEPSLPSTENLLAMPLAGHLIELRRRLLWTFAYFIGACLICYGKSEVIFQFMVSPLFEILKGLPDRRLIYTGLPEAFVTLVKTSVFTGFLLSFPVLSYHIWRFIAPALYAHERRVFNSLIIASPALFFLGAGFAFYVVIPQAWAFFLSFESAPGQGIIGQGSIPIQLEARMAEYFSMLLTIVTSFALCFQLPVILYILGRLGIMTADNLRNWRKHGFIIILILSAALTPPDVISMVGLALPLYFLYEISIFFVGHAHKKRTKNT